MHYQLKVFSNLLIIFAIFGLFCIFFPPTRLEVKYQFSRLLKKEEMKDARPIDSQFGIVIPKISANSKVFANIDPGNHSEYERILQKGVAHAKGTDLPGGSDNIYLFAHSTDFSWNVFSFNAVFYLLHNLENGDEISIYYLGRRYNYYVFDKKIVEANEVSYLTKKYGEPVLTLQTCWPPGTTLKRLLVFAKPR